MNLFVFEIYSNPSRKTLIAPNLIAIISAKLTTPAK